MWVLSVMCSAGAAGIAASAVWLAIVTFEATPGWLFLVSVCMIGVSIVIGLVIYDMQKKGYLKTSESRE